MVRWAISYWKTIRNRKGKYLCAVGTPTCHMSQPPPFFALSFFLLLSFSPPCISVFPEECVSPQYLSLDGGTEGQLVSRGRAVSHWVRWLRLRWEEEESKRGGEPRETELLLRPPLSPALWKYVSKYKDTHMCQYMRTQQGVGLTQEPVDFHLCAHNITLVAITTVIITALREAPL